MQAVIKLIRPLGPLAFIVALAGCGGGAAPASTAPAASSPAAATSAAASKPAAPSAAEPASTAASALAKPAASAKPAAAGSAAPKPAASGAASGLASAKPAASGSSAAAITLPRLPATVAVSVDPKTTAFLVLDINSAVCQPNPVCMATVPAISAFLKKARDAKMPVVYSTTVAPPSRPAPTIVPAVAPRQGEQSVAARADKFINTDLDAILKKLKVTTLVIVGTSANGAVLYSSFHANALGYTVVVPVDGISSGNPFVTFEAQFQLLNQPGLTNAANKPLAANAVTLSRTDQITIK